MQFLSKATKAYIGVIISSVAFLVPGFQIIRMISFFYNKLIVFESSIIGKWIYLFKYKYEDADLFGFLNADCMIIVSPCE